LLRLELVAEALDGEEEPRLLRLRLQFLAEAGDLPTVMIQVLPYAAGAKVARASALPLGITAVVRSPKTATR